MTRRAVITLLAAASAAALISAGTYALVTRGSDTAGDGPAAPPQAAVGTPSPTPPPLDARGVLERLTAAGLITNGQTQDEASDPNHLLGRPGGYSSRASFEVAGVPATGEVGSVDRGGVVEVFPTADAAAARAKSIQDILKASPILGTEYHYRSGAVLVRVSGGVAPSVAARFEPVVDAL